ncbi:MAG: flagellar biosynthetic protein FliO [Opitutus sp.]
MSLTVVLPWMPSASHGLRRFLSLLGLCLVTTLAAAPVKDDLVIVPNSSVGLKAPASAPSSGAGVLTFFGVLVLGGAGGWLLWRARSGGLKQFNRAPRQLAVEETRSLGNRQYLVVASYQDKKFLIGVCPGRIELLSALQPSSAIETEKVRL